MVCPIHVASGTCTCTALAGQRSPFTGCCHEDRPAAAAASRLPTVIITYEMYQGIPAMSKKVSFGAGAGCHTIRGLKVISTVS